MTALSVVDLGNLAFRLDDAIDRLRNAPAGDPAAAAGRRIAADHARHTYTAAVRTLARQRAAVIALHQPDPIHAPLCGGCGQPAPCPTSQALEVTP